MPLTSTALPALARLLMALIFVLGGWGKLFAHDAFVAYLANDGLPLPGLTYWGVVALELLGGLAILFGLRTREVAAVLAMYCLATGFIAHLQPDDRNQMIHFWKNVCMAGGFLELAAFGAGAWSLDAVLGRGRAVKPA